MKTCEDCGCRVYEYGCVNCNEQDYIDMQAYYDDLAEAEHQPAAEPVTVDVSARSEG
jgi:hypothetical protein